VTKIKGIDEFYCNIIVSSLLEAYELVKQTSIMELLKESEYGKSDTIRFDSFPETSIKRDLAEADPDLILITEEQDDAQDKIKNWHSRDVGPVVCIGDPTDRSWHLENFFGGLGKEQQKKKFCSWKNEEGIKEWEDFAGGEAMVSGGVSALTVIRKGIPICSAIINYITGDLYVACEKGRRFLNIAKLPYSDFKWITLEKVFNDGEVINFSFKRDWEFEDYKRFVSYAGKEQYKKHLNNCQIFLEDPQEKIVYKNPGGPTRILYLSDLWDSRVGFILANGEKIIEWIHWIPFIASGSEFRVFEIFFENAWTKYGILTATSRAYSIFEYSSEKNSYLLNIQKIKDHPFPARYRSTLLVAPKENRFISSIMETNEYTELKFKF